jgi:hypothetical protein
MTYHVIRDWEIQRKIRRKSDYNCSMVISAKKNQEKSGKIIEKSSMSVGMYHKCP